MLDAETTRVDVDQITGPQFNLVENEIGNVRSKSSVPVPLGIGSDLLAALDAMPRDHITIINTEHGRPFTVDGFNRFMRDAITAAGLPLECKPTAFEVSIAPATGSVWAAASETRLTSISSSTISPAPSSRVALRCVRPPTSQFAV